MYLIKETCVGCHNCAMECPMQAISYVGRQYQIDQEKCVQCGLCEKLCHSCSIIDTEAPAPVPHVPLEKECDVLVCGGGTGVISAVKAAQQGKKVILIEKAKKLGGNSDYAHGFFPIYTKWHEKHGLEDLREKAIPFFLDACGHELEEDVIRTAVYGCGEFFDWLCENGDMEQYFSFMPRPSISNSVPLAYGNASISPIRRVFDNLLCRDEAIGPGWGYTVVKHTMLDAIRTQKLDVEILTETAAWHLMLNEDGKICGVLARDPGGEVKIWAGAVILATGGFARSDEKMQKYFRFFDCDTVPHRFTVPSDTGDAIDMLQELGVEPDPARMFTPYRAGPSHHPYSFALNVICSNPMVVQFNLNGKRWRNEDTMGVMSCPEFSQQPKQICWTIMDHETLQFLIQDTREHNFMLADNPGIMDSTMLEVEEELAMPRDVFPGPAVRRADSIAALAEDLGIDGAVLEAEIERYNSFCEQKNDEDFHKNPMFLRPIGPKGPYYAIYGQRFVEMAAGGLRVDGQCRVLREDGTPIPGLYGVGDATSAMHRRDKYAVISELTWATASAYKSGEHAASYVEQCEPNGGDRDE